MFLFWLALYEALVMLIIDFNNELILNLIK